MPLCRRALSAIESPNMSDNDFWSSVYTGASLRNRPGRFPVLRLVLLFGMVLVALTLVALAMVNGTSGKPDLSATGAGIDATATGSIERSDDDAVCVIDAEGRRSGDC